MAKPHTIEEYINQAPKESREKLKEMLLCLRRVAPKAQEGIKWGAPSFSYQRILFTFAGFKHHIGFYPTPSVIKAFTKELAGYTTAKGSIQFRLDEKLPVTLIRKLAKYRIKELTESDARWM